TKSHLCFFCFLLSSLNFAASQTSVDAQLCKPSNRA
ncbi:unnamed protein product, partial [Brassica rapa subsp. trilocularis]